MLGRLALGIGGIAVWLLATSCGSGSLGPGGSLDGFTDSDGTSLHYVIDLPDGDGPFPAVVYGPGSGNVTVKSRLTVEYAERLLQLGFAVVRYDKRGAGESEGEILSLSTENSGTVVPQLAADMTAVLRAAQGFEEIDRGRLAIFGVSQAAWYAPVVASEVDEVQFMIMVTAGLLPVGPQNHFEFLTRIEGHDPLSPETIELVRQHSGSVGFDQRPLVREFDGPMLYLMGEVDPLGPFELTREEAAVLQSDGVDITLKSYPQGVHALDGTDFWGDVRSWIESIGVP